MPTGTFTFSSDDFGNSSIVPEPGHAGSATFTIHTERGFLDLPILTTLTSSDSENTELKAGGAIDWSQETLEIIGTTKPLAEVKHRIGGYLSL